MITRNGGGTYLGLTGGIRTGRTRRSKEKMITLLCRYPTRTQWPTLDGQGSVYRRKLNGSSPHAVALSKRLTHGAMNLRQRGGEWRTFGKDLRGNFPFPAWQYTIRGRFVRFG